MNESKVSVIIPVLNGEKTLEKCLYSVLQQSYQNFEVIVVDNNSTDKTKEIIYGLAGKYKKIKYVFEVKRSRGAARNAGIRVSTGKIVVSTDCDCMVSKDWLEELTYPIRRVDARAVQGFQKDSVNNFWSKNLQKADLKFIQRVREGNYINHVDTKNFAIEASLLKKNMFDPNMENFDDLDLYLRLKKRVKIVFILSCTVLHKNKSTFLQTVITNFDRGYWTTKIFRKYLNDKTVSEAPIFESISLINFVTFPFWIIFQLFKRTPGEYYFLLVSELSWRAGIIKAILRI